MDVQSVRVYIHHCSLVAIPVVIAFIGRMRYTLSIVFSLYSFTILGIILFSIFKTCVFDSQSLMQMCILHNLRYHGNSRCVKKRKKKQSRPELPSTPYC